MFVDEILAKQFKMSKSEVKRIIRQNGLSAYTDKGWVKVQIDGAIQLPITLRLGKRRYVKLAM